MGLKLPQISFHKRCSHCTVLCHLGLSRGELAASNARGSFLLLRHVFQPREWLSILQSWGLALFGGLILPVTRKKKKKKTAEYSRVVNVLNQHKATRRFRKGSYEIYSINIHIQVWALSLVVTEGRQTNQQHTQLVLQPWNGISQNFHLWPARRLPNQSRHL